MKTKLTLATFTGLLACCLACCAQTATAADAAAPAPSGGIIPLIQFQDVALTTAIENLARQSGLNYILDPKVTFGQAGPDGKMTAAQPNISIRWENLTAEQALSALLTTYSLQLVDDPKTKVSRITVKDPAAPEPLETGVIQLKYANPSNVLASVQSAIDPKRGKVVVDMRTSQLVVVATEKELVEVKKLVDQLDTPTKQVLIEAKILETTLNPKTAKGIDWSGTLSKQNITFGNNALPGTAASSNSPATLGGILNDPKLLYSTAKGFGTAGGFLNADGLSVALSFLNNSADTKTISEPRVVTLDNQKAKIDVGLMYPIVNVSAGTANTAGGSTISYSNLTVNLDVTPRITANDIVEMKVLQGILKLGPKFQSTVGGVLNNVDSFFTRRVETTVLIPSGNTLVMGGLISDGTASANTKVPILGDIPGVGLAFRHDSKSRDRQNLIIFITPTIVKDNDFQPAHGEFLKSSRKNDEFSEEWSNWDSGKPYDWSKFQEKPTTPPPSGKGATDLVQPAKAN